MTNGTENIVPCPTELVCAMYVDGELSDVDARTLVCHLDLCPRCRELVRALRVERNALVGILGDVDAFADERDPVSADVLSPADGVRLMGLVIGLAAVLRMGPGSMTGRELPWNVEWLNPLDISGQLTLMFGSAVYFIQEGGSIMASLVSNIGFAAFNITILSALFLLLRRTPGVPAVLGSLALVAGLAAPAEAIDIRRGGSGIVSIEADEIIDDTLVVFGNVVRVDGMVTGDLIVFARSIDVQGTVGGDVFIFGQRIEIDGEVGGGIAGFGQLISVGGTVGQSVFGFGQSIFFGRDASIEGDLTTFGEDVNVGASIGRNVTTFAETLTVEGEVTRDVTFAGRLVAVQSSAAIDGDLNVKVPSESNLQIDPGATVSGDTLVDVVESSQDGFLTVGSFVGMAIRLAAAFVSGMILFWAFPVLRRVPLAGVRAMLVSSGVGFLILIAMPVAALVLAVTLIGLPAGLVAAAVWGLGVYVSKIVVAHFLGTALLRSGREDLGSMALALLAGLVLVLIAVSLPYVGGIVNLLLVILGLGASGIVLYRSVNDRAVAV